MKSLKTLGLSQYEEKIYLALLKMGVSEAKDISKISGVPPTATYPNLKSLATKGLIHHIIGDVSKYEALEPKIAIKSLLEKKKKDLEAGYEEAIKDAELARQNKIFGAKNEPIKVSMGFEMSAEWFFNAARTAQKEIFVMGWKFKTNRSNINMLKAMKKFKDEKKDFKLIVNNPEYHNNEKIRQIKKLGIEVRYYPIDNFSLMLVDGKETKITLKDPKMEQRISIMVDYPDLSNSLRDYFLTVWKKAKKV